MSLLGIYLIYVLIICIVFMLCTPISGVILNLFYKHFYVSKYYVVPMSINGYTVDYINLKTGNIFRISYYDETSKTVLNSEYIRTANKVSKNISFFKSNSVYSKYISDVFPDIYKTYLEGNQEHISFIDKYKSD